ncbi:MAG: peptidylprolyl isomerase [Xenococcaceae cyanobacterium MO_234.B1]|nr:peptidylprolyl isomerase [Xenococcaceae cyanobacterium MO_234.B1]
MTNINFCGINIEPEEIVDFLKQEMRLKEVCQKILYQQIIERVAQEKKIIVTSEEIQAEADKTRQEKRLEKASDAIAWLTDQIVTADDWEKEIHARLLTQKLAHHLFDKEVEKFFAQNRLDFDQFILYQIVVSNERLAQELFYQLEEEEISFYEAAHLYDLDEKRRYLCGYEGKLYRRSLKPDIAAVVFGAAEREIVGPLKTEQGYHLFMIQEFIEAELTPQKRQEIIDNLFKEWLVSELNYLIHNQQPLSSES